MARIEQGRAWAGHPGTDDRLPRAPRTGFGGMALALALTALAGCADSTGSGSSRFATGVDRTSELTGPRPDGGPVAITSVDTGALAEPSGAASRYPGTDRMTGTPTGGPVVLSPGPAAAGGPVSLNFVDTDVREVVKAVLGDTLGRNFIIDPAVQGTVTFQTSQPLSRQALAAALDEILSLNGATLIESDGLYKVVPADRAARAGLVSRRSEAGPRSAGAGVVVVPLRHVAAAEMEAILKPFAPPNTLLRIDSDRNLLVLGGTGAERTQLMELIDVFDVDWLQGMSFAVQPIKSTTPETMVGELETIFAVGGEGQGGGLVRFVPVERLNAILIISPRREMLAKAESWIRRLDVGDSSKPQVYVYFLQNSRAEEIADVLNQIFLGTQPQRQSSTRTGRSVAPGLSGRELRDSAERERASSFGSAFGDSGTSAFQADTGAAAGAAPAAASSPGFTPGTTPGAQRPASARRSGTTPEQADLRIIADPVKNALIINAKPQDYKKVEAALQRLDIQSLQVLIEATFIEVGLTDDLAFGTEFFFRTGSSEFELPQLISSATGAGSVFSWALMLNDDDIRVTIQAIQNLTEVNIVSSPNLLVLDNQEARIQIGGEEPVPTRSSQSVTDPDAPIVSSIEYRETGTILAVTPRVNESGLVTLELEQEVSNVAETVEVGGTTAPTFTTRTVQSTIAVHDGESIVLGGQIFEADNRTKSGVPFLSQVPVLGFLFGTQGSQFERTELIVIITPRVIRNRDTARDATETLNQRMQRLRPILEQFRVRDGLGGT